MTQYSNDFLLGLYRTMLRIRCCEESFVDPILNKEIRCPVHLCSGEEAVAVGLCSSLSEADCIFGNHRSHGHFLAKGGCMNELVAEVYCREAGCSRGRGGSMHLIDPNVGMLGSAPIVAGTISLGLGGALAASIRKDKGVSVCFFGDGSTGEGVLYESLNFAALKKLPIVFACENNFYSTHMPIEECRVGKSIYKIAEPLGIESHAVDGNDVLQVYEVAKDAIEKCREGKGPVFLEFNTYRMRGHVGPDDNIQGTHQDIRPSKEVAVWRQNDPIKKYKSYLLAGEHIARQGLEEIEKEVQEEVSEAHQFAKSSPHPTRWEVKKYVYA